MKKTIIAAACLALLGGCAGPNINNALISDVPASAESFAVAQRAVRACTNLLEPGAVARAFQRAGFQVARRPIQLRSGSRIEQLLMTAPDPAVHVIYYGGDCYVGLDGMTPAQSVQLAQPWVAAHEAQPNAAFGDGLADGVAGAWRRFIDEPPRFPDKASYRHRIFIAAYQSWPTGIFDPQGGVGFPVPAFPADRSGAAVRISHTAECRPQVATGPNRGVFLPCSGPAYRPR